MATILLVDDEECVLFVYENVLGEAGYKTIRAKSGMEAIEHVKTSKIDAIMLDINMPDLDGAATLEKIREMNKDVPVIILSALGDEHGRGKITKSLGVSDYLLKPISNEEVLNAIKKALET